MGFSISGYGYSISDGKAGMAYRTQQTGDFGWIENQGCGEKYPPWTNLYVRLLHREVCYLLSWLNRRVRNRTHGGVRGRENLFNFPPTRLPKMLILFALIWTDFAWSDPVLWWSKQQVLQLFRNAGYKLSDSSFYKIFASMVKGGELARVGNGLYCLPDNNARPYDHEYSDLAVEVTSLMQKKLTSLLFIRIICINYRLNLFHQSIIVILVINSTEHRITHNITVSVN